MSGGRSGNLSYAMDSLVTTTVQGKDIEPSGGINRRHNSTEEEDEDTDTRRILHDHPERSHIIHKVTEVSISYGEMGRGRTVTADDMPSVPVKSRQQV